MATLLLYQQDSYLRKIKSSVTDLEPAKAMVALDQTIIYPGGGGQPADRGTINGYSVSSAVIGDQGLFYQLEPDDYEKLTAEKDVLLEIDWAFRYNIMRLHTAQHILAGVIMRHFDTELAGNYINPGKSHMDIQIEKNFTAEECRDIQEEVNEIVESDLSVKIMNLSFEEAKRVLDPKRVRMNRLPAKSQLRLVKIGDLDTTACGGTHVKKTSEIVEFRIIKFKSKGRNRKRFYFDILD